MQRPSRNPKSKSDRGYVLLTLIFFVAVLAISLATILPSVIQEARRDREEELVHRGAQYERAIRLFYKKNGRYPAKVEDLENTNMTRYLRRRYKDPMAPRDENGAEPDFKILHIGDPGVRLQEQQSPQATAAAAAAASGTKPTTNAPLLGGSAAVATQQTNPNQTSPDSATPAQGANGDNPAAPDEADANQANGSAADKPMTGGANQSFGGGAMVGVVSTNRKDNTIREFNKKHRYYEWQFIYDPVTDRGGIPTGPWQPPTFGQPAGQPVGQPIAQPIGNQPASNGNPQPTSEPQQ